MIQTVELHPRKIDDLNRQPKIETKMYLTKDKKWLVHKTIITDFKPSTYVEQMVEKKDGED